jgi:predicted DNA-binding protein with PD1-like motif
MRIDAPLPLRLQPGQDLKAALEQGLRERRGTAAWVLSAIGSLRVARLRLAGHRRPTVLQGPLEITSLAGSLSPDGAHLHIVVANARGKVTGGHLLSGSLIHTTAEVLLVALPGYRFRRVEDPATGYRELAIRPRRAVKS